MSMPHQHRFGHICSGPNASYLDHIREAEITATVKTTVRESFRKRLVSIRPFG